MFFGPGLVGLPEVASARLLGAPRPFSGMLRARCVALVVLLLRVGFWSRLGAGLGSKANVNGSAHRLASVSVSRPGQLGPGFGLVMLAWEPRCGRSITAALRREVLPVGEFGIPGRG